MYVILLTFTENTKEYWESLVFFIYLLGVEIVTHYLEIIDQRPILNILKTNMVEPA